MSKPKLGGSVRVPHRTTKTNDKPTDEKEHRSGNTGFASCGVTCLNSSAVFQFNFSAWLTVLCPENPQERQAALRCAAWRSCSIISFFA